MKRGVLWVSCDGIDQRGHHIEAVKRMAAEGKIPLACGLGRLDIYHDDWCGIWTESKRCDCNPEVTYEPPDDVKALVRLEKGLTCWLWLVVDCPYCGKLHVHGGGKFEGDPRKLLGHRVAHCGSWGYELVEEEP